MTQQIINVGSDINTRDGDIARVAFQKINDNFSELYGTITDITVADTPDPQNTDLGVTIDITKQIHKLTTGAYYIPDGVEGQIMYLVPADGATITYGVYIRFEHVRCWVSNTLTIGDSSYGWGAFVNSPNWSGTVATIIFTDGAWNIDSSFMID